MSLLILKSGIKGIGQFLALVFYATITYLFSYTLINKVTTDANKIVPHQYEYYGVKNAISLFNSKSTTDSAIRLAKFFTGNIENVDYDNITVFNNKVGLTQENIISLYRASTQHAYEIKKFFDKEYLEFNRKFFDRAVLHYTTARFVDRSETKPFGIDRVKYDNMVLNIPLVKGYYETLGLFTSPLYTYSVKNATASDIANPYFGSKARGILEVEEAIKAINKVFTEKTNGRISFSGLCDVKYLNGDFYDMFRVDYSKGVLSDLLYVDSKNALAWSNGTTLQAETEMRRVLRLSMPYLFYGNVFLYDESPYQFELKYYGVVRNIKKNKNNSVFRRWNNFMLFNVPMWVNGHKENQSKVLSEIFADYISMGWITPVLILLSIALIITNVLNILKNRTALGLLSIILVPLVIVKHEFFYSFWFSVISHIAF
jgi:hypothetical protein